MLFFLRMMQNIMGGHVEEWKPSREILERYNAAALDLVGVLLNVIHAVFVCFE